MNSLPQSSLHDRVYEIIGSCYSPEIAPQGDVKKAATEDILEMFKEQRQQIIEMVRETILENSFAHDLDLPPGFKKKSTVVVDVKTLEDLITKIKAQDAI